MEAAEAAELAAEFFEIRENESLITFVTRLRMGGKKRCYQHLFDLFFQPTHLGQVRRLWNCK